MLRKFKSKFTNIKIVYKPGPSIASLLIRTDLKYLFKPNDLLNLPAKCGLCNKFNCSCDCTGIVYKITCLLCDNASYIGETSKSLRKRVKEHWLAACKNKLGLSSVADHFLTCHSTTTLTVDKPLFTTTMLAKGRDYKDRKIKEALLISSIKPSLNRNMALTLTF
jgi:hypothetical protein